jgi:hypothetical protein
VAEVRLKLLRARPVLCRVQAMTSSYREQMPRPIRAPAEIKVMALLVIRLRVTWNLPRVMGMKCDEGSSALRCNKRFGLVVF